MTAEPIDSASLDKMIAFLSILGHLEIVVCPRRQGSCPSDSLVGDCIDHGARSAPGMQAEKETVVGKRFHEPERRPKDAIVIVVDGRCDDRPSASAVHRAKRQAPLPQDAV